MSKKIQLTIAEPCHENWEGMSPVEKGRFCGSCQKQVVDFSNMSDRQVAEFFKKPSTGSVCGRFMTDQLDRTIEIPKKRMPWVKYFFQIAIPAFLITIKASAQKTQGQLQVKAATKDTTRKGGVFADERITLGIVARPQNIKPFMGDTIVIPVEEPIQLLKGEIAVKSPADTIKEPPVCVMPMMGSIAIQTPVINKNEIKGKVVNEEDEPVPFASIEVGNGVVLIADENGLFVIDKSRLKKGNAIAVSSAGFETKTIKKGEEEYVAGELYVQLKANVVLDEIVVKALGIYRQGKITGYTVSKPCKLEFTEKKNVINKGEIEFISAGRPLLVYPNPVKAGTALNLSFKQLDEGYYQLQLLNQSGQSVKQQEIWIDAEARLLNIDIPAVAAGSYFMLLTNKKTGKKYSEKIIIQ